MKTRAGLEDASPLRADLIARGLDLILVRELSQGIYYGRPRYTERLGDDEFRAVDTASYTSSAVRRITKLACEIASARRSLLTIITKPNVLATSRLFSDVAEETARSFPRITVRKEIVDAAAFNLIVHPDRYDVIVTTNQFGDILGDEIGAICGSLGLVPSAAMGTSGAWLYEAVHGSAPDIAGKGVANPLAMIMCLSLMFRHTFDRVDVSVGIDTAIERALEEGFRTIDIAGSRDWVSTSKMAVAIANNV